MQSVDLGDQYILAGTSNGAIYELVLSQEKLKVKQSNFNNFYYILKTRLIKYYKILKHLQMILNYD